MPLEERVIQPIYVSRGIIDGQKNTIYNLLPNELECFTNETLANIIKQLSSLAMYAEDLFASILQEITNVNQRTNTVQQKVNNLLIRGTQLDSVNEDVSLHDIHLKKPYKAENTTVQEIFSKKTLPKPILEQYYNCSKPPALHLLNKFRDDGKDSMTFYTNPNYFFELWRDAALRQIEKEKNSKKVNQRLSNKMQNGLDSKGRKPRQPANSNERYRKMISAQEFLVGDELPNKNLIYMPNNNEIHYDTYDSIRPIMNGNQQHYAPHNLINNNINNPPAYYNNNPIKNGTGNYSSQPHSHYHHPHNINGGDYVENNLIQNNINCTKHNAYPNLNHSNGMHNHHSHQQPNGNNNNNNFTQSNYLNSQPQLNQYQQDQFNQMQQQQNHMQTLNRRSNAIRPTQPPPQPPPQLMNGNLISSTNEYHQTNGYVNHYSQSNLQQQHQTNLSISNNSTNLSNMTNASHQQQQQNNFHNQQQDDLPLPPPMPINLNGKLVSSTSINNQQQQQQTPQVPIPPPPPMPNLLQDVTDNAKITTNKQAQSSNNSSINSNIKLPVTKETSFEQEILLKQKQLQPIKHINRPPPKSDPRNDLLASIREGIKLRKVEDSKQKDTVEKTENLLDVASILARRVAMELSDSSSDSFHSDNDDNDWNDESHV